MFRQGGKSVLVPRHKIFFHKKLISKYDIMMRCIENVESCRVYLDTVQLPPPVQFNGTPGYDLAAVGCFHRFCCARCNKQIYFEAVDQLTRNPITIKASRVKKRHCIAA
jgi:hypothetical protein